MLTIGDSWDHRLACRELIDLTGEVDHPGVDGTALHRKELLAPDC